MSETKKKLIDLLDYVDHMVKLGEKPVFNLNKYNQLKYHEIELKNRIGITHDIPTDEGQIWINIERLRRIDPPDIPKHIEQWVSVSRDPYTSPKVKSVITETISKKDAEQLVEEGILMKEDIQGAIKPPEIGDWCDVIFRLDKQHEIREAIDLYINGHWQTWSQSEKPRRESIRVYESFFNLQQTIQSEGTERPLEVVWGIGMALWNKHNQLIARPLVEQLVEIEIDTKNGAITIRPRSTSPVVALEMYFSLQIPGTQTVLDFSRTFFDNFPEDQDLSPFLPETWEPILRQAATHLDQNGQYYPDHIRDFTDRGIPTTSENLTITDTWVIFARRRSDSFYKADLDRLKKAAENADDLPGPAKRLVSQPSDQSTYDGSGPGSGLSIKSGQRNPEQSQRKTVDKLTATQPDEFFFPKPYNEEQISIIQRLEKSDGVVVQGPPGTGKTHTIANIICHYLATGRRVLVTSKGEAALTVLRDHIPEDIRDLTINLLTSEKEGLKQLETAIGVLSNTATQHKSSELERGIVDYQKRILGLKQQIASIDHELRKWARKHLQPIKQGENKSTILPMDLARRVTERRKHHTWFPDRPVPGKKFKPLFTDSDIARIRTSRMKLGRDLVYVDKVLPSLNDLPDSATISAIHQDLAIAAQIEKEAADRQWPLLSVSKPNTIERAQKLKDAVEAIKELHLTFDESPWLLNVFNTWRKKGFEAPESRIFNDLLPLMEALSKKRFEIMRKAVEAPSGAYTLQYLCQAVDRAANGQRGFGLLAIGKSREKEIFNQIKVEGNPPDSSVSWKKVQEFFAYQRDLVSFASRWNSISSEFDLPEIESTDENIGLKVNGEYQKVEKAKKAFFDHIKIIQQELLSLFPNGLDAKDIIGSREGAQHAAEIIKLNLSKNRLLGSKGKLEDLFRRLSACSGQIIINLKLFLRECIGNSEYSNNEISNKWQELYSELRRLRNFHQNLEIIQEVSDTIKKSGAPKWARALVTEEALNDDDPWTPSNWRESWAWVTQDEFLRRIDGRGRIRKLANQRAANERDLARNYEKLVKLKTYLGLKKNITERVEAALVMFTAAIRKIGKGTGIRAHRHRRDARNAMEQSYSAVPCWIMPSWRVSESLPSTIGSFDLVIVDEASQSDITALPALLRGDKVLIVGDDKQVSPTGAFIEERKLLQLRHNYLQGQPFAQLMLPGNSLYELANAVFPGKRKMLREHFRCVEPIIRFSMQFYPEKIIPLRIPKPSERLDPPLIDVYVTYGHKDRRQINHAEAEAIANEIEKITDDPKYSNRTIGVVSLIGGHQAQYIQTLLLSLIGEDRFIRHQIVCGDSATFQGKERDIMFVSMVECPKTSSAKTALLFEQRYNVALSRAKDRMYIYRSVTEDMLKPNDLKTKVIQHLNNPMADASNECESLIDLCESGFEREVFNRLLDKGYRVKPQVKVGPYSIDLVVEGSEDRRLAIELDGDQYHTPERWAQDYARQSILERVGWQFWRCWGSSFIIDPEGCMQDLVNTLQGMGIDPLGFESERQTFYTEHRVLNLEEQTDEADYMFQEDFEPLFADAAVSVSAGHQETELKTIATDDIREYLDGKTLTVEVGDRVLISYNDQPNLQHTIEISATQHDPDMKIIHKDMPLAKALIEAEINEEVEIPAGGKTRVVTILKIEKDENSQEQKLDSSFTATKENGTGTEKIKNRVVKMNPLSPDDLSHTRILNGKVNIEEISNWNQLAEAIHRIAFNKLGSFEKLSNITKSNIVKGLRGDKGYRPLPDIELSIQGESANKVWHNSLHLAVQLGIPLELEIEWRGNPKAAHPNKRAFLTWAP